MNWDSRQTEKNLDKSVLEKGKVLSQRCHIPKATFVSTHPFHRTTACKKNTLEKESRWKDDSSTSMSYLRFSLSSILSDRTSGDSLVLEITKEAISPWSFRRFSILQKKRYHYRYFHYFRIDRIQTLLLTCFM